MQHDSERCSLGFKQVGTRCASLGTSNHSRSRYRPQNSNMLSPPSSGHVDALLRSIHNSIRCSSGMDASGILTVRYRVFFTKHGVGLGCHCPGLGSSAVQAVLKYQVAANLIKCCCITTHFGMIRFEVQASSTSGAVTNSGTTGPDGTIFEGTLKVARASSVTLLHEPTRPEMSFFTNK